MKRISLWLVVHGSWIIVVGCLLFTFTIISCAKREIKNIGSTGKTIVCFGDSLTFGYGVALGEDYPTALAKLVSYPVLNMGIDGNTTIDALQRIERDVLERDPYLVIVEFAGNDFLKKVPKETTARNMRLIVDKIQAKGAMVAVVDISAGVFLNEYRGLMRRIAQEKQAIFVPRILNKILTNPGMKSDFLHPNAYGYKIVAQRIYKAIAPYL